MSDVLEKETAAAEIMKLEPDAMLAKLEEIAAEEKKKEEAAQPALKLVPGGPGEEGFAWMMSEGLEAANLWKYGAPKTADADGDKRLALFAGVVYDLAAKCCVGEDAGRKAFVEMTSKVPGYDDEAKLGAIWASRPKKTPALGKWPGIDPARIGMSIAYSPAIYIHHAWEDKLKDEAKKSEAKSKIDEALEAGMVLDADLDGRFSTIARHLRDPKSCRKLTGAEHLRFNILTLRVEADGTTIESMDDLVAAVRENVETKFRKLVNKEFEGVVMEMVSWSKDVIWDALVKVGKEDSYSPMVEYLNALPAWDGVNRLDEFVSKGLGKGDATTDIERTMGRWFMIQAVKRPLEPGCQADYVLVTVGDEGVKKSSRWRALAPKDNLFTDKPVDPGDKDRMILHHQRVIVEWSELEGQARREEGSTKAYLTSREDEIRVPYGRESRTYLRKFVYVGTANEVEDCLVGEKGTRRYWVIEVGSRDGYEWINENRDQLWAEAKARYEMGERCYPDTPEEFAALKDHNKKFTKATVSREIDEEILGTAMTVFEKDGIVTSANIINVLTARFESVGHGETELKILLPLHVDKMKKVEKSGIRVLSKAGWKRTSRTRGSTSTHGYVPPGYRAWDPKKGETMAEAKTAATK